MARPSRECAASVSNPQLTDKPSDTEPIHGQREIIQTIGLKYQVMIFINLRTASSALAAATAIGVVYFSKQHYVKNNEDIDTYQCLQKQFVPMILSSDPLLIHIDEFVTSFEAEYLISLA